MKDIFQKLADIQKGGTPAALAIVVRTSGSTPRKAGAKMIIMEDGSTFGTLGGGDLEMKVIEESLEALRGGQAKLTSFHLDAAKGGLDMMCGGEIEIYIDPLCQPESLIIFGAGHISRALAPLMRSAGFRVTLVEENPDVLEEDRCADVEGIHSEDMESYAEKLPPGGNTYIVILTRGFSKDKAILQHLVEKDYRYVGMTGSRKKIGTIKEHLISQGIGEEHISKLHAPIGLDIGAETPEEIAISIAAEIISVSKGTSTSRTSGPSEKKEVNPAV
jgi:xanthine dehydrogenase accessory factor